MWLLLKGMKSCSKDDELYNNFFSCFTMWASGLTKGVIPFVMILKVETENDFG